MPFTAPPPPPNRNNPADFSERADAFLAWFVTFVSELNDAGYPVLPVLAAAGSAAAPSHSFSANPNMGLYRAAANQMGFSVGGAQRALLTSAAFQLNVPLTGQAVVQSNSDATAGRLMTVGFMGWGGTAPISPADISVAPADMTPGFYSYSTGTATGGPSGLGNGTLIHMRRSASIGAQIMIGDWTGSYWGKMWTRVYISGAWAAWRLVYDQGSVLGTVSQTAGVPTGALLEQGSSANGQRERRASGFQTAIRTDLTVTNVSTAYGALFRSGDITWTFPAAHAAGELPVVTVNGAHADVIGARITAISETSVTFNLIAAASITGAVTVRAAAQGRWSNMT